MTHLTRTMLALACLCLALPALAQSPQLADSKPRQFSRDIRLTEVLNHRWTDELVTYTLDFPAPDDSRPAVNTILCPPGFERCRGALPVGQLSSA